MSGAWDAINSLGAVANMSDEEMRRNVKPQYDADMKQYKKDLASYESRLKVHEAAMAKYATKKAEHEVAMAKYAQDMQAWNASKNWFGRTKLPQPAEPAAPAAPAKPAQPVKPDSVEKRIADAKASARAVQEAMRKSIMY